MQRPNRVVRPILEGMEVRFLLSAAIPSLKETHSLVRRSIHPAGLHGTLQGEYQILIPNPDVGAIYQLSGQGNVNRLGPTSVSATFHGLGFIARGQVQGDLTLDGSHGASINLHLTAQGEQGGFSALPSTYSYRVTDSTGTRGILRGTGLVTLRLTPGLPGGPGQFAIVLTRGLRGPHA